MVAWKQGSRANPKPCREQDQGKFEMTQRDGWARCGLLHTAHGVLETPALLPVVNPNIQTITPREMWDKYGIQALITNSYVISKHEHLKEHALKHGVHDLLDFPGVVMTDSGTFQSYVYGDIDVGPEEIVAFQRDIGVDIATMLDEFSRPDMTEGQVKQCIDATVERSAASIEVAGSTMLNGPVQGGIFRELRISSAMQMAKFPFTIHPLGGIVPIMEQHNYKQLVQIMLATIPHLPKNRPIHMFGCGHPMLFPMLIALGADLFDSAAYALFARDGRILTPWGTEKIDQMVHWPIITLEVHDKTPEQVRAMEDGERTKCLARYNLEITLQEISRCKQAVHDGTIWELAERRSHQHPALREAFLWLTSNPSLNLPTNVIQMVRTDEQAGQFSKDAGLWEDAWDNIVLRQESMKTGGVLWGGLDTFTRPYLLKARRRLHARWSPRTNLQHRVVVFHGVGGLYRESLRAFASAIADTQSCELCILTPLGLVPYGFEDVHPFAHIDGPKWMVSNPPDEAYIRRELSRLSFSTPEIIYLNPHDVSSCFQATKTFEQAGYTIQIEEYQGTEGKVSDEIYRRQIEDKVLYELNFNRIQAKELLEDCSFICNRQGRMKNVINQHGKHILSTRLQDGGLSLTDDGALAIDELKQNPLPVGFSLAEPFTGIEMGLPKVVIVDDALPFVEKGRNVFHGFVVSADPWITPGDKVLVTSTEGRLVGHGLSQCSSEEFGMFTKGVAVRIRSSFRDTNTTG
jgi:7-cyano-7-deazaguanine tRNA-ribosyltransferase